MILRTRRAVQLPSQPWLAVHVALLAATAVLWWHNRRQLAELSDLTDSLVDLVNEIRVTDATDHRPLRDILRREAEEAEARAEAEERGEVDASPGQRARQREDDRP